MIVRSQALIVGHSPSYPTFSIHQNPRRTKKGKVRIGTMDLKIASIAKSLDVLLLTANEKDFSQVPGLRRENWLR